MINYSLRTSSEGSDTFMALDIAQLLYKRGPKAMQSHSASALFTTTSPALGFVLYAIL